MGYEGLLSILKINAQEFNDALEQEKREPLACPECGIPLEPGGKDGQPFCRADGWRIDLS